MATRRRSVDYRVDPFDLHLFAAVVEHGSITAAAQAVSLSLGAASERIRSLEASMGVQLLNRSKAGTVPNDAGRALARQARRVLSELEALHVEMAGFGRGLRGTVRVLCNTVAMSEALPSRLGRFLVQHPELDVDVQELPSDAVVEALRKGSGDMGIVADYVDTSGLVTRPWLDDQLVVLWPAAWPLRARRSIRFADLLDRPFVGLSRESGLGRYLAQQAGRSGRVPRHRVRLGNFDAVAQLVAAGVGVAVVPASAADRLVGAGVRSLRLSDAWATRRLLVCATEQGAGLAGVQLLAQALLTGS